MIIVLVIFCVWGAGPSYGGLSITVVYDNSPYLEGATADWGFSCLVKAGREKILFDTGKDSSIFFSNITKLGIDLKTINTIVISHLHEDHFGGLFPIMEKQPKATVFLPTSTPEMQVQFQALKIRNITVEKPIQIGKGLFLTGDMGTGINEQALIINTPLGLIIIAGCSHPGITNIISKAKGLIHRPVYLVIGGFHSMPETTEGMFEVIEKFRSLGVRKVGPAHCTDEKAKAFFKAAYGKNYISIGAGKTLNFSNKKNE
ncbi:MAG: MBL fold metallo-hydrolase [Proteobacteria bacterium]|nr:MBL fold metallo-hydrolase [Pseudomonadota bacterium]MBU1585136.1 MBL fold metallo-hydrolase [Pseudomonadota bacterium]MBU2452967.1 MBL fold metallo-hydrolase [Pseudomonadota bacterium]